MHEGTEIEVCGKSSLEVTDPNMQGHLWLPNKQLLRYHHTNDLIYAY